MSIQAEEPQSGDVIMHTVIRVLLKFRRVFTVGCQLLMVIAANWTAFLLRFDSTPPGWAVSAFLQMLPWLLVVRGTTFFGFRLYEGLWRYTSIYDVRAITAAVATSSVLFAAVVKSPLGPAAYPRSVFITDAVLLLVMLCGVRLSRRIYAELSNGARGKRVLVFGAGSAGEMIVRDMKMNAGCGYLPIGFIDDDLDKVGRRIHGVPVLGTRADVPQILRRHKVDEVLVAIPTASPARIRDIVRSIERLKVPIKTVPGLRDIIDGKLEVAHIRSLSVEDLLARAPIGLDPRPVKQLIRGRRVMVTGAGGSIGSELCRQIVRFGPAELVMFERYENSLHAIRLELEDAKPGCALHPIIGDVADRGSVVSTLQRYQPEIIFHAAAHKHVPLMEENPCEAIKNNVKGTRLLAEAAELQGVDRFILISTDKAVNPTSVMGASKRLAELAVQTQAIGSGTSFAIVRFGNVLGSNGSVVPRFLDQINRQRPVTITHREMRRFFMLIPEAVQLVMHAAAQAESGGTYVLEMGEQVKLVDMARDLIRLAGFVPDEEIPIEFIGLRPGEKLYEELVGVNETVNPSATDKVFRVTSSVPPDPDLFTRLESIEDHAARGDVDAVLESLKALIPEYSISAGGAPARPVYQESAAEQAAPRVAPAVGDLPYSPCPKCHSPHVRRSHSHSVVERLKRGFTQERLFRCDECGWRGWLMPWVFADAAPVEPAGTPDLSTLDRNVAASPAPPRRSFSPRNLN